MLHAEIGHQGANHSTFESTSPLMMARDYIQQLVAIVESSVTVDHNQTIAVAVERDAEIGAYALDRTLQRLRMGRAATEIDVESIGFITNRDHVGAQFMEYARRDVVDRTMGAVDHQLQAAQVKPHRKRAFAEFDVAIDCIVDTARLADPCRFLAP